MATIINNPQPTTTNSGMGYVVGVILLIVVLVLFFIYGLPRLTGGAGTGASVNLPSTVNVNTGK